MSHEISKAIEAMEQVAEVLADMRAGDQPLRMAINALQALQSGEPVVDEAVFDILKAAQGSCRLGLNDIADNQIGIAIKALLSAGKGADRG